MFKNKLFLSLFIFFIIFATLGLPYTQWGFNNDDVGTIDYAKKVNLSEIFSYFKTSEDIVVYNLWHISDKKSFIDTLYRPLHLILVQLQFYLFGENAYWYLLVTVFFHALNSIILFNILLCFFSMIVSLLGALFFAFNLTLFNWLGLVSCQKYVISLTFVLLSIVFLKKYYWDKGGLWYYFLSCLLFLFSLLLLEHSLFMPLWVFGAIYFIESIKRKNLFFGDKLWRALKISTGYILSSISYLLLRMYFFPIRKIRGGGAFTFRFGLASFFQRQKERIFDFVTMASDMLNLRWLRPHHHILKGTLILLLAFVLIYPFWVNKKVKLFVFLFFSFCIFSWFAILNAYQPRYIYLALPFLAFISTYSLSYYLKKFESKKQILLFFVSGVLLWNIIFLIHSKKIHQVRFIKNTN